MKEAAQPEACQECHDAGWVIREQEGVERAVRCPSCTTGNRRRALLQKAAIPPRYQPKGFDDYKSANPSQKKARAVAISFANKFPLVERGLLLVGPCGVGKTHLSVAVLQTIVRERLVSGRFVDEAELLRRLQYSYGPDSPETQREVMVPLMEVDLLVWDDLGVGNPTKWVAETIRTILNHRYTHKRHTILTTNWLLKKPARQPGSGPREETLGERIGHRLYSRVLEMCRVVPIEGEDFRIQIRKAGHDTLEKRQDILAASSPGQQENFQSMLACPECGNKRIEVLTQADKDRYLVDFYCQCRSCQHEFRGTFNRRSAQVEYQS
ncbi:MAG: ATP-binding protein [Acidobacteriota bacterium]